MSFFVKTKKYPIDKKILWITLILLAVGLIGFISASLGVYTKNPAIFKAMMVKHVGFGVFGGLASMYFFSLIDFNVWRKLSPYLYVLGIIITLLVFVPGLGMGHGGARRWISLGFISFQPAEILKFTTILFISAWTAFYAKYISEYKKGLIPFLVITGLSLLTLVKQPDTGSLALIAFVSFAIYWLRGAPFKHVLIVLGLGISAAAIYVGLNPYIIERIKTFSDTSRDPYGASYQIRQSRIAIGSGGLYGRGVGQSVQKFGPYLPESNSDAIFAVFAEEWGFVGSFVLILLYTLFAFFGFGVVKRAPTLFAQNLALGIVLLIVVQVFLNIAAISGIIPLSGMPLIFMSNGGTALLVSLSEIGILLNISRFLKKKQVQRKRVRRN